jgi:hypothetical protein
MGGTESADSYEDWNLNQADVADFISSGAQGADILTKGLKTKFANRSDGGKIDSQHYYDKDFHEVNARAAADTYAAFRTWMDKREGAKAESNKWREALAASPGRDSTIIGYHAPKQTVIG